MSAPNTLRAWSVAMLVVAETAAAGIRTGTLIYPNQSVELTGYQA